MLRETMSDSQPKPPPLIALVGRPNVGKSTLFNRLVGERRALVDDRPGVTRDRNYGIVDWAGMVWRLVDTGGFEPKTDDDVLRAMRAQTEFAVAEADVIVFMLDGREGVTPSDHEVADALRRSRKPVICAVNKVDGPRHEDLVAEFYELGVDRLFPVSAEHSYGVGELLDEVAEVVPGIGYAEFESAEPGEVTPRIAVVGKPNVGKSTLINALLGEERLLVHDKPGTTRDTVDSTIKLGGVEYVFVDTAGMRRKSRIDDRIERFSVMRAISSIERSHVSLVVIDATEGVVDQDAKIAGLAHERGRAVGILFNKWDLIDDKDKRRAELEDEVEMKLPHVDYAPLLTISALKGIRTGKLPMLLQTIWESYNKHIGGGKLNKALERYVAAHHPPAPGGKLIKLNYIAQSNVRPPTFVIFTNLPEKVPAAYQRYLVNKIRDEFEFEGTPIKVIFRAKSKRRGKSRPKA